MGDVSGVGMAGSRRLESVELFRALGHPLRLRILELVRQRGPLTATEVGRLVVESAANCSFHLRVLGDCGLIEPAPDPDGRRHPWRAASTSLEIDPTTGTTEERLAARSAVRELREADAVLLRRWDESQRDAGPVWRDASFEKSVRVRLTGAQLAELRDAWLSAIDAVQESSVSDSAGADGADGTDGAEMVQLQLIGFPARTDWT